MLWGFCPSNNSDTSPQILVLILLSWEYKRSAPPYSTDASEEGTKGRESARYFNFFEELSIWKNVVYSKRGELAGFKNSKKERGEGNIILTCNCPLHIHFTLQRPFLVLWLLTGFVTVVPTPKCSLWSWCCFVSSPHFPVLFPAEEWGAVLGGDLALPLHS